MTPFSEQDSSTSSESSDETSMDSSDEEDPFDQKLKINSVNHQDIVP